MSSISVSDYPQPDHIKASFDNRGRKVLIIQKYQDGKKFELSLLEEEDKEASFSDNLSTKIPSCVGTASKRFDSGLLNMAKDFVPKGFSAFSPEMLKPLDACDPPHPDRMYEICFFVQKYLSILKVYHCIDVEITPMLVLMASALVYSCHGWCLSKFGDHKNAYPQVGDNINGYLMFASEARRVVSQSMHVFSLGPA